MSESFAVGDIVYLKSGGPPMCVQEVISAVVGDFHMFDVVWIAPDGHCQHACLPKALLSTTPAYWWPSPTPLPAANWMGAQAAAYANLGWPQIDSYKTICSVGHAAQGQAMQR